MENFQKPSKFSKRKGSGAFDPARTLDPISRRILQIEIANPDVSAQQIKGLAGLELSVQAINQKRRAGLYQKVLADYQMSAIQLIVTNQSRAVRKLRDQLDHSDPRIAQRAALFFAESARDIQYKQAEYDFQRAHLAHKKPMEVIVKMDGIGVLGQTFLPPLEIQHSAPQASECPPAEAPSLPPTRQEQKDTKDEKVTWDEGSLISPFND
jgi:hypothetical protein